MPQLKKILIADDDPDIVEATSMLLESEGYEVIYTLNGNSVLHMVEEKPHLILLDVWMAGVDGRDICKKLKSEIKTKDIPVIMFSASKDIAESVLDNGADAFLEKPFEFMTLVNKIENLILVHDE